METLIFIGVTLALVTTMLVIVERMAETRGRNRGAWTLAAFVGICLAVVGWFVVMAALVLAGLSQDRRQASHHSTAPAPKPSRP